MSELFTNIYPKIHPNLGKYTSTMVRIWGIESLFCDGIVGPPLQKKKYGSSFSQVTGASFGVPNTSQHISIDIHPYQNSYIYTYVYIYTVYDDDFKLSHVYNICS